MSKIVVANFKSNKTLQELNSWLETFVSESKDFASTIVLCPPFPFLALAAKAIEKTQLKLGTQDISPFPAGAYTGAVSVRNLEGLNVTHAIVGHSERRRYFHETDNDVANKVRESIEAGITPIVCVTKATVTSQAHAIEANYRKKVIVAFEPVENIGTGITDTLDDILATKTLVTEAFGEVPYLYGGSVDPKTDQDILNSPEINGFLVGGASLSAEGFGKLVQLIS